MGIKLKDIIKKKELAWESLNNKKIAVDASNTIFQFLSSIRQPNGQPLTNKDGQITSHLIGLFSRVPNLMEKGLKLAFVFDGKAPELKHEERKRREMIKKEAEKKLKEAEKEENIEAVAKYSRMTSRITPEMIEDAKELLDALGIPIIQAPSEAEAQAAHMCRKKKVWAVATQDYDSLLFGAPRTIQNLTLAKKRKISTGGYVPIYPQLIELKEVLDELELNQDELIILGILVGTDFNVGGVKGLGPKKALALVQKGKRFKDLFKELDVNFDWETIFNIFKEMPVTDDYELEWKKPDKERIKRLLIDKHGFSESRVENTLKKITAEKKQTSLSSFM